MLRRFVCAALLNAASLVAEVPISIQVLNKPGGKQVEGLTASDIALSQAGEPLAIGTLRLEEKPLDLVIVIDRRRWEPFDVVVQDSLGALAARLRGDDRVGLIIAGPGLKTVVPPGSPPGEFAKALTLANFEPGVRLPRPVPDDRGPMVYDAILTAVAHDAAEYSARRAVLVIGSGYDRDSQSTAESLTQAALSRRVIVSLAELPEETFQTRGGVMGRQPTGATLPGDPGHIPPTARIPPPYPTPRPLPRRSTRTLETVVERTGGEASDDWRGGHGLSAMVNRMRSRYEVELAAFDARLGELQAQLEGAAAKKNKKAVVLVQQPSARPY